VGSHSSTPPLFAADKLARERVDADPTAKYVSPYDNPLLWTGHSTVVDEIVEDLDGNVGAVVVSVGGGGLICGVLEGFSRTDSSPKVIAAETTGASSFGQAWEKGEIVTLPGIDSIATVRISTTIIMAIYAKWSTNV
jgi:L-serine/L-threonine ammonia-lyase